MKLYAYVDKPRDEKLRRTGYKKYDGKSEAFMVHYYKKPMKNNKLDDRSYFSGYDMKRDDPALVKVVEELGEKANGDCAKLKVVEIPDGVAWEIDEYDGNEEICEAHKKWS